MTTPEPADLCVGPYKGAMDECLDPHCGDRDYDNAYDYDQDAPEAQALRCDPYSPPAAVCGNVDTSWQCSPGCCKTDGPTKAEQNVEALADAIVAGVLAAREEQYDPDPFLDGTATRLFADLKPTPDVVEDEVAAALAVAEGALRQGKSLLVMDPGTMWKQVFETEPAEESILQEAERIVNGPRRASYGHPAVNFARIAHLWNGYLKALCEGVPGTWNFPELSPQDICQMMIQLKQCRIIQTPTDRDGHVDIAGYSQCSKLIAERDEDNAKAERLALAEEMD